MLHTLLLIFSLSAPIIGAAGDGWGKVSTLSGSGEQSLTNGVGTNAEFSLPSGIAVSASGFVYVSEVGNNCVRRIDSSLLVSLLAGGQAGSADGTGTSAAFSQPRGVAVDASENVYVADSANHRIRVISPGGVVSTLAGGGATPGFSDGTGTNALFSRPSGVAVVANGSFVYVADTDNHAIRVITPDGVVTTIAGGASPGYADGVGTNARFRSPFSVAVSSAGTIYLADSGNHRVRSISALGAVTTLAGSNSSGLVDGTGTFAKFSSPRGIGVAEPAAGGAAIVYLADYGNNRIRAISTLTGAVTAIVGSGDAGFSDAYGTDAMFLNLSHVAVDRNGTVYVADEGNHRIRAVAITSPSASASPSSAFSSSSTVNRTADRKSVV